MSQRVSESTSRLRRLPISVRPPDGWDCCDTKIVDDVNNAGNALAAVGGELLFMEGLYFARDSGDAAIDLDCYGSKPRHPQAGEEHADSPC